MAAAVVHQVVSRLESDDAVGNEVRLIRDALRQRGCESDVYVANRSGREDSPVRDVEELLDGPSSAAVLYHFATASRATALLADSRLPLVLVYHNVTPAQWFWGLDRAHYEACANARRDLLRLLGRVVAALGHSEFSCRELSALGFVRTGSFPLLVADGDDTPRTDDVTRGASVLLCVGRIAPHKCVEDVIRTHHALRRDIARDIELRIVGDGTRVPRYTEALRRLVDRLDVLDSVHWLGSVSRPELIQQYRDATALVSMSEHEGFAGTLVEAMRAGTPVVAHDAGAVGETLGGAGVLLPGKDIEVAAEAVGMVVQDAAVHRRLAAHGRRRAAELSADHAFAQLVDLLLARGIRLDSR